MLPEVKVIVNPASKNGQTGKLWPSLSEKLTAAGVAHQWEKTTGPGDGKRLAREAVQQGFKRIIAVGGDGTINEVINGLFENDRLMNPDLAFGVLSMGTGGDFVKAIGVPTGIEEAISYLKCNRIKRVDIGKARFVGNDGQLTERYFLNIADLGLGAETVERVNRSSKALGGFISFLWGALVSLLYYRNKTVEIAIDDDEPFKTQLTVCAIANGTHFGGGMKIAPLAKLNDGVFDVILCHDFSRFEIMMNMGRLYGGTHLNHPKVKSFRATSLKISSPEKLLLELDGEQPGVAEVQFSILPLALNLCVPPEQSMSAASCSCSCTPEANQARAIDGSHSAAKGVPGE
jgi:diacylglycerol kinase (ATP)